MGPANFKLGLILITLVPFFPAPVLLNAAEFKLEPLVVTGQSAPGGETFLAVGIPQLNSRGDVAFAAYTASGSGVYVKSDTGIGLLYQFGTVTVSRRLPDPESLGLTLETKPCTSVPAGRCAPWNPTQYDNYFLGNTDQLIAVCDKQIFLSGLGDINDSLDILVGGVLVSGGSVAALTCPAIDFIRWQVNASFVQGSPIGITSSGTVALLLSVFFQGAPVDNRIALVNSGGISLINLTGTEVPLGTVQSVGNSVVMNDNAAFLVPYRSTHDMLGPQGLLLLSGGQGNSVASDGSVAPGGRTFRSFSGMQFQNSVAINNTDQVIFAATLDNGSSGIFRREPDGTFVTLAQDSTIALARDTRQLSVNGKGDGAVLLVTPFVNTRQDILFLGASGASKIVGLNDALPGEGKFLALGFPEINNKGEVIFFGLVSNGKSGIFVASQGMETEFVDPVPDLLADATIISDEKQLAEMGRLVTGIAADGAARVVVRVKTGQPGTVDFSLVDESGAVLPASNFNGSLSEVSEAIGSGSVSVPADHVDGLGPMAFAVYHAPMDFATSPDSVEASKPDRKVFIRIRLTTALGETMESTESLRIVRPPVVLVHGLWESLSDWNTFTPLVNDSNLFVKRANYNFSITGITDSTPEFSPEILAKTTTNALGFSFNASFVLVQIVGFIDDFKDSKEVAAIQADLVAHSMGGNVARNLSLIRGFFSNKTFGKGTIHKMITIGTPHLGTPLATQLLKDGNSCVRDQLAANENISFRSVSFQGRTFDGGVFELEGDGVGGALSRALRSLQQPGSRLLPTAMVAGVMNQAQLNGLSDLFSAATFIRLRCAGDPLADSLNFQDWPTIFGQDSDAIVPLTSQLSGLSGSRFTAVHSSGTVRLGFRPPHEYEEASNIPSEVIKLLNTPLTSGSFHLLPP